MSDYIKKLFNFKSLKESEMIGNLVILILIVGGLYILYKNLSSKGSFGTEMMSQNFKKAYSNSAGGKQYGPQPAQEGGNEVFSAVNGVQTSGQGIPSSCNKLNSQNPDDLLPKDNNSQWAQLNPVGKGDLANINLLKAGYHIGIDTIGQTLRNGNLQIRSEPPNPQLNVGPWNLSTIEPDFMRPPLEIGQGGQ
jgi:hypothetical protein